MKLSADDCRELRGDLDELLEAVRELQHELGSDNEEVQSERRKRDRRKTKRVNVHTRKNTRHR